jgi:Glycosyl transferases group 1
MEREDGDEGFRETEEFAEEAAAQVPQGAPDGEAGREEAKARRQITVTAFRVAVLAPISWRVPPRAYGPWEQFASLLTEGLVEREVDVTLFATGDSLTAAKLASVVERGYSEDPGVEPKVSECLHIAHAFERATEFDVIHNGFDFLPLTYSELIDTPLLTTIHGFSSPAILPVYQRYNGRSAYVAISDADRHPSLDYLATIHHGIDTESFSLHPAPGGYLLFFGRIHPDKGAVEAIEVAERAGMPLTMAGIVQDRRYFDEEIAPRIDGDRVSFLGTVGPEERVGLLGGAHALLHLIGFEEPFGYSVVEAMACGTPVIAFRRGSMPELIDHGRTGFLVDSVDEAVAAVDRAGSLDRLRVRGQAVARFDKARMIDAYLDAYRELLDGRHASGS